MNISFTHPSPSWLLKKASVVLLGLAPALCAAQAVPTPVAPGSVTVPTTARSLVAGRDYWVLAKPMPAPKDRLEVAYFFWYNSPSSAKIDPVIRAWAQTKASAMVKFKPLPAVLDNSWSYGARLFFALDELDKETVIGPKLMQAMSQGLVNYNSPKSLSEWMNDQGISKKVFNAAVNRPTVVAKTSWMPSLMKRYGVERVPTVVMDGQFMFPMKPTESPQEFMARISFASEALTQRKLQEIARERAKKSRRP